MQAEGTQNSTDSLENLHYSGQPQVVLDGSSLSENQSFTQEGMGELKRPLENDDDDDDDDSTGQVPADSVKPATKKTRGRVKIDMKFITNKLRRYTTFSKRKTGIMKKAYELSTLTGTQVMLLVASETGHVYTFATRKLQPMITSDSGKALIQTCLNSPDPPVSQIPNPDQRMSATGYEETDLTYTVNENDAEKDRGGIYTTQQLDGQHQMGLTSTSMTGITAMPASGHSFPITTYIPQQAVSKSSSNSTSYSVQAMPGGGSFTTIFTPGSNIAGTAIQIPHSLAQGTQQHGVQQVQLQRGQVQTTSSHSTPTITTVHIGSDGQIQNTQEHAVENIQGNPAHVQSLGTLMVPIATHQGEGTQVVSLANVVPSSMMLTTQAGQIPVMYYTGQSSGIMSVSQLSDGDHTGVQNHQLQGDGSEVSHSLAGTLSLSGVHVTSDHMTSNYHGQNVVTENSGTQAPDDVHNMVNESSMNDDTSPKEEMTNSQNQNEV
ncbi:serum response factor-like isoform X2 [Actinia tenebrosa]|uniref:Serum response factor-like isoform X2 n=1 Tax=Actinia tenebrosa TaxID=6105 RepID=A0A6P8I5K2_ACTTE|nr:serum response factor-like isoform X2 [Actinia tenebrosa]